MHLGAWPGGSWLPWRAAPLLLCSCSCLVFKRLPQEWSYLSFHLLTCTMGFAPIKWTCTAFFRPRQLTDRAILANRQTQEKKRRFLHLNEYLRNLAPDTANATIDAHARGLTEHLVEFLAEWILMALEPARAATKTRAPDFLFLHEKDFWFNKSGWTSTRRWC